MFPVERFTSPALWAASRGAVVREAFGIGRDPARPEGDVRPAAMADVEWNASKVLTLAKAFRDRFTAFLAEIDDMGNDRGVDFIVWDGARSLERQVELYGRGRLDKGTVVTQTIASNHLWGMAVDVIVRSPAGQPVFALPKWWVKDALPLAAAHKLESLLLARGLDPPHIQVPAADLPPQVAEVKTALVRDFKGQAFYADYP